MPSVISSRKTPIIQVSSRGNLYAPNRKTWHMWTSTTATMKFDPQPCTARRNHPSVTLWLRNCRLFQASAALGTYSSASMMPVKTCRMKMVSAALPKTYHQLADVRGIGCSVASRMAPPSCSR